MKVKEQINELTIRILRLEIEVRQLKCEHEFKFKKYSEQNTFELCGNYPGRFGKIVYKCSKCDKTKTTYWKYLTRKEQRALKTLNLVPEYWEVKK